MSALFTGLQLHDRALKLARQAADRAPDTLSCQWLLAAALTRSHCVAEARSLLLRLTAEFSLNSRVWATYADLSFNTGNGDEGFRALQLAGTIDDDDPECKRVQARFFGNTGRKQEHVDAQRALLAGAPNDAERLKGYAVALSQLGEREQAVQSMARACELVPEDPDYCYYLASLKQDELAPQQTFIDYQGVLERDSRHVSAMCDQAMLLMRAERLDEALAVTEQAVEIAPDRADAIDCLSMLNWRLNRPQQALELKQQVVEFAGTAKVWNELGFLLVENNRLTEGREAYYKALDIDCDYPDTPFNLSLLDLLEGDLEAGWHRYERRWQASNWTLSGHKPVYPAKEWAGESVAGKTILLYAEGGIGDSIQFLRYIPLLIDQGASVVLHCQDNLVGLAHKQPWGIEAFPWGAEWPGGQEKLSLPPLDYYQALMSLPGQFYTGFESIPQDMPYITVPASSAVALPKTDGARAKVGVVWSSNPQNTHLVKRNLSFTNLEPLLDAPGIAFYSLQIDTSAIAASGAIADGRLLDLAPLITSLEDTAALISQLDLVISVDTLVAHLAGAMDVPTWLMLPLAPDWRWHLDRDDSPWYRSMRLFRQPRLLDWGSVVQQIGERLQAEFPVD